VGCRGAVLSVVVTCRGGGLASLKSGHGQTDQVVVWRAVPVVGRKMILRLSMSCSSPFLFHTPFSFPQHQVRRQASGMDAPLSALFWRVGMVVVVMVDGVGLLDDDYTLIVPAASPMANMRRMAPRALQPDCAEVTGWREIERGSQTFHRGFPRHCGIGHRRLWMLRC